MPGIRPFRLGAVDPHDLRTFNRWLCVTRVQALAGLAALTLTLGIFAPGTVHLAPTIGLMSAMALVSAVGLRLDAAPRRPVAFFYVQQVVDLAAITVAVCFCVTGVATQLMRLLYIAVIVPPSLISAPAGMLVALAASASHVLALSLERGRMTLSTPEALIPPFLFFVASQQCRFYGMHLASKNRALAALAEVARTLTATLDAPELLGRLTQTVGGLVEADWSATFLVDAERRTFRLAAATGREPAAAAAAAVDFPLAGWPELTRLDAERIVRLEGEAAAHVPAPLAGTRALGRVLLAGLHDDGALTGFLAVGWRSSRRAPESAERLVDGIAEHATIALRNARLLEEVQLASALKSEFVGAVSHELRSPLNVILGYTDMVRDGGLGPVTEDQAKALDRAHLQALALLEMITALLDLNRLEAGRLPVERMPVRIVELLDELSAQVPDGWQQPGVELRFVASTGLPVLVTDTGKLKTILRNLVHNALKFTPRGHVTVRATGAPGDTVAFSVEDTGCGIPAEALPYVFDMFRQVPGSGGGGVGLGLHLVRRFVEALGGEVAVVSRPGVGTRFTVTLPVSEPGTSKRVA